MPIGREEDKMFSPDLKKMISEKVQQILQETYHSELPEGEINFLLHVDGAEAWSWANIRNNSVAKQSQNAPNSLVRNMSV